jgi:tetratricopeptide (TPR) repeat protein
MARLPARSNELLAGVEHHKAGRLDRAEALYQKVLAKSPTDPDAHNLLGTIALSRGRSARAIQLIERAIASAPNFADAHSNLGNAYRAAGRPADAADSYRRAITLRPAFPEAHSNLAQVLNDLGEHAQALASSQRAIALAPALPEPHRTMASALRRLGREPEAKQAYRQALTLRPNDPDTLNEYGHFLAENRIFDEAIACHQRALALRPDEIASLLALAGTLRRASDIPGSVAAYRRATEIDPNHTEAWTSLGHGLRAQGRFEEAHQCFDRAIAIDPDMADAYRGRSLIRKRDADPAEIQRLGAILHDPAITPVTRVTAGFALGKSLDDADRYDEAFARYSEANALYRETLAAAGQAFDPAAFTATVDRLIARFDTGFFAAHAGCGDPSELPVFVLGMPRSGTSLIEQIAASHPLVHGAGERSDIGRIESGLDQADWDRTTAARLASAHCDRLRELGGKAVRVIDKMPDNILKLGVIGTLFPNARVIFCTRDARDTCLSCFFQFFPHGNGYSYDLAQTGQRHVQIERLAAHWREVLPLRMMEANYEALVHDLEGQSRAIVNFLGLPWDPACLDFHLTDRVVQTASAWQVRQPLYDRAAGRWRRYRDHLGPLNAALGI